MQRILVPTDFSTVADNATDHAIEIASKFQSEIYLCHVYKFNKKVDYDWKKPEDQQPFILKKEEMMEAKKEKFKAVAEAKGVTLHTIVAEDSILALFKGTVRKNEIDLIVMGSKGASGFEKMIFGSVAATALEMSKVPVLVVPPDHTYEPFDEIIFARDEKKLAPAVLNPLLKLAKAFDARVKILNVSSKETSSSRPDDGLLEGVTTSYYEIPLDKDINECINDFVESNPCQALCMVRRKKSFFDTLFKKSVTTTQVYNSKTPLMVLPEKPLSSAS